MIAVNAATFLVRAPPDTASEPENSSSRTAGFAVIRRTPALLGLLGLSFAFFFLFGPLYVALPLHVSDGLGGPAGLLWPTPRWPPPPSSARRPASRSLRSWRQAQRSLCSRSCWARRSAARWSPRSDLKGP